MFYASVTHSGCAELFYFTNGGMTFARSTVPEIEFRSDKALDEALADYKMYYDTWAYYPTTVTFRIYTDDGELIHEESQNLKIIACAR